jgi:ABC-type transport system involved in multi-copper enzyme maturation permease subunit
VKATLWIAINVFRESVRDKVLYNLVVFAILMIGASYLIGQLTAGQDIKIIKDLGLSAIAVFGLFIAVFIGIQLVSKEVERRSIYSMLSKPIHRHQLVLGKYLGLVLTLAVNLAVMVIAFYVVLAYMQWTAPPAVLDALESPALDPRMLKAVVLIFGQLAIVTAIAVFFSSFSSPILSASFTIGLYVAGHFSADLRNFDQVIDSKVAQAIARGFYWLLPNLAPFDVKSQVVHAMPVPAGYIALTLLYGVVYVAVLLTMAVMIFSRRDFK